MAQQVEVRTYRTAGEYERDAKARVAAGWTIAAQTNDPGRTHRVKKAASRGFWASLFLPGIGTATAAVSGVLSNKKDGTITVTWVRP